MKCFSCKHEFTFFDEEASLFRVKTFLGLGAVSYNLVAFCSECSIKAKVLFDLQEYNELIPV